MTERQFQASQQLSARERNQARANGTLVDPPNVHALPPPEFHCLHRSVSAVGKVKCGCSSSPDVYSCSVVPSKFCVPKDPTPGQFPPDGPIIMFDGTTVIPDDERTKNFVVWNMKPKEEHRLWEVIVCPTCPHRKEPAEPILKLYKLGIDGDFDPETGHCDILHVLPDTRPKPDRVIVPSGSRECSVVAKRDVTLEAVIEATACKLAVLYGQVFNGPTTKAVIEGNAVVKFWMVATAPNQRRETLPNVWYDLPDDLHQDLAERTRAAYTSALGRILS